MDFLLKGLQWVHSNEKIKGDIRIRKGLIEEIGPDLEPNKKEKVLYFDNHFVYPGLINAHDHLEMNLYPKLGNPPYGNYTQWGKDIYKPDESPLKEIEKVNINDRLLWGGIKNLISGVTTVVHHNPWKRILSSEKFPIQVLKKFAWAHSLQLGKNITKSFPQNSSVPFVIHAAEGIDEVAFAELRKLNDLGLLKQNTVLIHGVALSDIDVNLIEAAKASVIWCPASNVFLFNQTAPIEKLKSRIKLSLGSDSTLTGSTTLLDEMRFAYQTQLASSNEIFEMVTTRAAEIFNLSIPTLRPNANADLFIAPIINSDYRKNLTMLNPHQVDLVAVNGAIRYCNESIANELGLKKYFAQVNTISKWFFMDVLDLKRRIYKKTGLVVEENPLWQLIQ